METTVERAEKYVNKKGYLTILNYVKWDQEAKRYEGRKLGVKIPVRCLDMRRCYGRLEILIRPVLGSGSVWVQLNKVNSENSLEIVEDWDANDRARIEQLSAEEHDEALVGPDGP